MKRKGVVARRGLKEAWSECVSRRTGTGYEAVPVCMRKVAFSNEPVRILRCLVHYRPYRDSEPVSSSPTQLRLLPDQERAA